MTANIKYRHELKYQCDEIQIAIIKSRLSSVISVDPHAKGGVYTVRSLYFDDIDNRCFKENERGTDPREKYRIRIYNADGERISLECKRKERSKTYKRSCLITKSQYENIIGNANTADLDESPALLREFLVAIKTRMFSPSIIVEYERIPYVYKLGNVRITIDQNIRSSNDFSRFFEKNLSTRQILPHGKHLLEIKYDEFLPDFIKEVLQLGELQQSTFSKFYLCKKFSIGGKS